MLDIASPPGYIEFKTPRSLRNCAQIQAKQIQTVNRINHVKVIEFLQDKEYQSFIVRLDPIIFASFCQIVLVLLGSYRNFRTSATIRRNDELG